MRRTALKRTSPMNRSTTSLRRVPEDPWPEFNLQPPARAYSCALCGLRAAHWHHWLDQRHLKLYVRSTRLRGELRNDLFYLLIHDRRNISSLCLACHGPYGTTTKNLLRANVPDSAFDLADELGPEWVARLEHDYPGEPT
jgi:hypothetical protein